MSNEDNINAEKWKILLESKQREVEDLAFSINLLETETKYRIDLAEKEKEREVSAARTNLSFKEQQLSRSEQARKSLERSFQLMQEENQRLKETLQQSASGSNGNNIGRTTTNGNSQSSVVNSNKRERKENYRNSIGGKEAWPSHTKNKIAKVNGEHRLINSPSAATDAYLRSHSSQTKRKRIETDVSTKEMPSLDELYGPILSIFTETSADLLVLLGVVHLVRNENDNVINNNCNGQNTNRTDADSSDYYQHNNVTSTSEKLGKRQKPPLFNPIVKTPAQEYALNFGNNSNDNRNLTTTAKQKSIYNKIADGKIIMGDNNATFTFTPSTTKPSPFSMLRTSGTDSKSDTNAFQEPHLVHLSFQLYTHLTRVIAGRETPISLIPKILPFVDTNNSRIEYHSAALGVLHRLLSKSQLSCIKIPASTKPLIENNGKTKKPPITGASGANTLSTSNTGDSIVNDGSNKTKQTTGDQNNINHDRKSFGERGAAYKHPRIHGINVSYQFALQYEKKYNTTIDSDDDNKPVPYNIQYDATLRINEYRSVENVVISVFRGLNCFYSDIINLNYSKTFGGSTFAGNNKGSSGKRNPRESNNRNRSKNGFAATSTGTASIQALNEYFRRLERCIRVVHTIVYKCNKNVVMKLFKEFMNDDIILKILANDTVHVRSKQLLLSIIQKLISIYPIDNKGPLLNMIHKTCSIFLHIPLSKIKSKKFQLPLVLGTLRIISAVISNHEKVGISFLLFSPGRKLDNIFILLVNLIEILSSPLKTYENELNSFTLVVIREGLVLLTVFLTFIFGEHGNLDIGEAFGKLTLDGLWLIQDRILKYGNEHGTICNRDVLSAVVQSAEALRSILSHD
jgi:hypothetical protein